MRLTVKFKVESMRTIEDPMDTCRRKHLLYVDVANLPDNFPMMTNPRKQNLGTRVAKTISRTFVDKDQKFFHILNRGITISAANVYHNRTKDIVSMDFLDVNLHGNIDGGHTYRVICRDRLLVNKKQFVCLEILEGYEDIFVDIAAARNTSVQVKEKSIMELRDQYNLIKDAVRDLDIANHISYVENEEDKVVDIEELISLFYMFDIVKFGKGNIDVPIVAATSKAQARMHYSKTIVNVDNSYDMMFDIMPDIIKLANHIETNIPKAYNSLTDTKSYFGRVPGITSIEKGKKAFAKFAPDIEVKYVIPKGILYPVISAFRYLLEVNPDNNMFRWTEDPFKFADEILPQLTLITVNRIRSCRRSIMDLARDKDHWTNLYREVELKCLRDATRNAS